MAITSTSANKTKQRPIKNYREACRHYGQSVHIVKGRIGGNKKPSQIQDFETKAIIRK
jgi:tRNA A37 threonylcarbamoyladenosine synthetase subunit TsaC/SUA5/YrdC